MGRQIPPHEMSHSRIMLCVNWKVREVIELPGTRRMCEPFGCTSEVPGECLNTRMPGPQRRTTGHLCVLKFP